MDGMERLLRLDLHIVGLSLLGSDAFPLVFVIKLISLWAFVDPR
jgi:hypothetical protein